MGCCDDENSLGVPKGDPGDQGLPGIDGANGVNAYTSSTEDFIQPAVDTTVTIHASNATWIGVGQIVFIENGGYYQVAGTSSTTITVAYGSAYSIFNQALTPVGGTVASGAKVSAAGLKGDSVLPYLVYIALIIQSGTSNPVVSVKQNTLGVTIVWERLDIGIYQYNAPAGTFPFGNKTAFIVGSTKFGTSDARIIQNATTGGTISSLSYDLTNPSATVISLSDDILFNTYVEIRVYP